MAPIHIGQGENQQAIHIGNSEVVRVWIGDELKWVKYKWVYFVVNNIVKYVGGYNQNNYYDYLISLGAQRKKHLISNYYHHYFDNGSFDLYRKYIKGDALVLDGTSRNRDRFFEDMDLVQSYRSAHDTGISGQSLRTNCLVDVYVGVAQDDSKIFIVGDHDMTHDDQYFIDIVFLAVPLYVDID